MALWTPAQIAWNSGMSDEDAKKKGFEQEFIALEKKYGCASIPMSDIYHFRPPTEAELNQTVGGGLTYGEWAGITGKGKLMREIIKGI